MMFIWIPLLILLVYLLLKEDTRFTQEKKSPELKELKNRLAKGEISIEEYQEIRRLIKEENDEYY